MSEKTQSAGRGVDAAEVSTYLRANPDFFNQHEQLLTELNFRQTGTGGAVPLIERQVGLLREQNRELERKLTHLAQVARGNEALLERMQRLILDLIDSDDPDSAAERLISAMHHDFHADAVTIRLFAGDEASPLFIDVEDPALTPFHRVLERNEPVCGYLQPDQLQFLFDKRASELASGSVIPFCEGGRRPCIGLLGIGSIDPKRFHPEMGTVFLAHLGAVAARVFRILLREQG